MHGLTWKQHVGASMDEQDEIIGEFLVESRENLDHLDQDLVAMESDPGSRERLGRIFRAIHSFKGMAGFLALGTLERLAHSGENLLSRLREGELAYTPERATVLLEMVDIIRNMLVNIEATSTEGDIDCSALIGRLAALTDDETSDPSPAADPVTSFKSSAVEIPPTAIAQERLPPDEQVESAEAKSTGQIPALADSETMPASPADQAGEAAKPEAGRTNTVAEANVRVDVRLLDTLMTLVGELVLARNQILQHPVVRSESGIQTASQRLDLITSELQEGVMKTRMQPIGNAWAKFPRVVRDLSVTCGKQVRLQTEGAETELDRTILEAIRDPLTHIVRNSVDHGIETAEKRVAAGKPAVGTLTLRAYHAGGKVVLEVVDDGGGIHTEKVKARALERGLITPERAAVMSEEDLQALVFLPGFSTVDAVSNVSGRGVGMDVVKTNIENIGGSIEIDSKLGEGTLIKIRIPLTLAIVPALMVSSGRERYAIPQVNVLELVRLEAEELSTEVEHIHSVPVYRLRGDLLPLVYLDKMLCLPAIENAPSASIIVVLQADERPFGLVVDRVSDTQEIVVKPLGQEIRNISVFAGSTIMGDGRVALILDVAGLAQAAGLTSALSGGITKRAQAETALDQRQGLLQFEARGGALLAVPLVEVARLEEIRPERIEVTAGQQVIQYRGGMLALIRLDQLPAPEGAPLQVVVYSEGYVSIGFVVERIVDIVEQDVLLERELERDCLRGTALIAGRVTDLFDMGAAVRAAGIDPHERRKQARLKEVA